MSIDELNTLKLRFRDWPQVMDAITEIERLRKALEDLRHAGNQCANCCYNLGQPGGHNMLTDAKKASMFEAARAWDKVKGQMLENTKTALPEHNDTE